MEELCIVSEDLIRERAMKIAEWYTETYPQRYSLERGSSPDSAHVAAAALYLASMNVLPEHVVNLREISTALTKLGCSPRGIRPIFDKMKYLDLDQDI